MMVYVFIMIMIMIMIMMILKSAWVLSLVWDGG